jgi:hypothetical protein
MGQIDSGKMYTNIMKWDWGNSEGDITMIQKHVAKALPTELI